MNRRHLPTIRRTVQLAFSLFCLYSGWQLYRFYQWAIGASTVAVDHPSAVEGFLPIGALVGLKRLILTHQYDPIHPAGLTIFLAALALGLLLRKGFCGWICPIGFASNLAQLVGRKLKISCTPPPWLDIPLLSIKYLLLALFGYLILWRMSIPAIEMFLRSDYNMVVDVKMLYFFLSPSRLAGAIMLGILGLSFFVRNPWCRYLCPYGALLGLLASISPFQVKRQATTCINCKKCERVCPASIEISSKPTMRNPECIGCLECVAVCPPKECLAISVYQKPTPVWLLPTLVLTLFFAFWLGAKMGGHWDNQLPVETVKQAYAKGMDISHPR